MRFMRCMECNKKISEKASVCPNCGCDIDYTYQEYLKYRKGLNNKLIHRLNINPTVLKSQTKDNKNKTTKQPYTYNINLAFLYIP